MYHFEAEDGQLYSHRQFRTAIARPQLYNKASLAANTHVLLAVSLLMVKNIKPMWFRANTAKFYNSFLEFRFVSALEEVCETRHAKLSALVKESWSFDVPFASFGWDRYVHVLCCRVTHQSDIGMQK